MGHVIAAYILIQTEAARRPWWLRRSGTCRRLETASLAGPYDVIARAQARDIDELAKLVTTGVQALDRVRRTMSCPVVTCEEPIAVDHHTTIDEVGEGGAQAVCSCGWRSPVFGAGKRPARWTRYSARPMLAICTSGRCPCDNWSQVPAPRYAGCADLDGQRLDRAPADNRA